MQDGQVTRTEQQSRPTASSGESLEQQVTALRDELAEAQKQSLLGELVGTTTHEFNNVLMTVINYARMGLRHQDDETRTKAFDRILTAANRANRIVNSVLGVAKNRSGQFETTCLKTLIEDVTVLMERELRKHRISLELELPDVPCVRAIGNQIQQVIMNLMINARQAMPDGGRLLVRLSHEPGSELVDVVIRDFGKGISPEQLPRIFDRGFSTKSGPDETGRGGSGFGLHACRTIIENHQGKIRVQSTPGRGTSFTLRLPRAKSASPSMANTGERSGISPIVGEFPATTQANG